MFVVLLVMAPSYLEVGASGKPGAVHFITSRTLLASTTLKTPSEALHAAVARLGQGLDVAARTLNEVGLRQRAAADAPTIVSGDYRTAEAAGLQRLSEIDRWRSDLLWKQSVDPAMAREIRDWLRSQKPGNAAKAALEDSEIAAAALANWKLSGVPATIRTQVEDATIRRNLAMTLAAQHGHVVAPTASNPLARGFDMTAAERAADAAIAAHHAQRAEVETLASTLTNAARFVAICAGTQIDTAHKLLTGRAA